jgi:putative phage-type endonuclease
VAEFQTIACPDRESWLKERQTGVGASDIAAILGVSPWKTIVTLWGEKTGLIEPDPEESEAMRWGLRLEPAIADAYMEETGHLVIRGSPYQLLRSTKHPVLVATLDGEVVPVDDKGPAVFEAKTGALWKKEEWSEEPPLAYQVQVQSQLLVTGYEWAVLAVLLGGQKFLHTTIVANPNFQALLIERVEAFWDLVQTGTPPPLDGSPSAKELLSKLFPKPTPGAVIELSLDAVTWDQNLVAIKEQLKALEQEKSLLENNLKGAIADAEVGVLPSGDSYRWSFVHKDVPAKPAHVEEYRMLRRAAKKEKR